MNYEEKHRKSYIRIRERYFWTATINNWMKLLMSDQYKDIIISSFRYLSNAGKMDVFAFVIMPNHIMVLCFVGHEPPRRLDSDVKDKQYFVIDNIIQNTKAKKALAS